MKKQIFIIIVIVFTTLACNLVGSGSQELVEQTPSNEDSIVEGEESNLKQDKFANDDFSLSVPEGWGWAYGDYDYYALGVNEVVTIFDNPFRIKSGSFFTVASAPIVSGEDLEARFNRAYTNPVPEITEISRGAYAEGNLIGFTITYKRPWGEPWWQFKDIWVEHDGQVYVLSFHSSPQSFDEYVYMMNSILETFEFTD